MAVPAVPEEAVSRAVRTGITGDDCPKCKMATHRYEHPKGFVPRPGAPYYFRYWDRCDGCGFIQHYEEAKEFLGSAPQARERPPMTPDQIRALRAIKDRLPTTSPKERRRWIAEQMGIEERYAIISEFDAVECATVIEICSMLIRFRHTALDVVVMSHHPRPSRAGAACAA